MHIGIRKGHTTVDGVLKGEFPFFVSCQIRGGSALRSLAYNASTPEWLAFLDQHHTSVDLLFDTGVIWHVATEAEQDAAYQEARRVGSLLTEAIGIDAIVEAYRVDGPPSEDERVDDNDF